MTFDEWFESNCDQYIHDKRLLREAWNVALESKQEQIDFMQKQNIFLTDMVESSMKRTKDVFEVLANKST